MSSFRFVIDSVLWAMGPLESDFDYPDVTKPLPEGAEPLGEDIRLVKIVSMRAYLLAEIRTGNLPTEDKHKNLAWITMLDKLKSFVLEEIVGKDAWEKKYAIYHGGVVVASS